MPGNSAQGASRPLFALNTHHDESISFSLILALLLWSAAASAQSLLSGFMNGEGKGTVALSYTAESYDKVFLTTQAGYSLRNGEVPNAVLGEIRAGYAATKFYVDAWYAGQISTSGVNILAEGFNGFFPATDVSFSRAGVTLFAPLVNGFGLSVSASRYLDGRNVGQATGFSGAVSYSF